MNNTLTSVPLYLITVDDSSMKCFFAKAWNWTHGILNFYIDGETEPSLSFTLLELAGESHFNNASDNSQNGNPGGTFTTYLKTPPPIHVGVR